MQLKKIVITVLFAWIGASSFGQQPSRKSTQIHADSMRYNYLTDSIKNNSFFSKVVMRNIFRNPTPRENLEKKQYDFDLYKGKIIDSIKIFRYNVFDDSVQSRFVNWSYKTGNHIHTVTKEKYIRAELMFKSGERVNPALLSSNEYLLRNKYYLSKAFIIPQFKNNNPQSDSVDIYVYTQDAWSIGADALYRPHDESFFSIYDDNFLGHSNRLSIKNYFDVQRRKPSTGVELEFLHNNILGSFFDAQYALGKGLNKSLVHVNVSKKFNKSNDYGAGFNFMQKKFMEDQIAPEADTAMRVKYTLMEGWLGHSFRIHSNETNIYLAMKGQHKSFDQRPEVLPTVNPYYHNQDMVLVSMGVYNEKFYKGNLIYGFGNIEDIPYGYKMEVTAGKRWSEFRTDYYLGGTISGGNLLPFGYSESTLSMGTYFNRGYRPRQTIFNLDVVYFSNLWNFSPEYHLRQFLNVRYTGGFNMLKGEREMIFFNENTSLRGLNEPDAHGTSRLIISPQSVLFTPVHLYGFRFAFFTYLDMGWLGFKEQVFNNDFYSVLGVGVRMRNERLIFKTIQFRLSFALNKSADGRNRLLNLSQEDRLWYNRFNPKEPNTVGYR